MDVIVSIANKLHHVGMEFYRFRHESHLGLQLAIAFAFAGLTGCAAQLRIPLPFTPVPITAQVFVVLLTGGLLGRTLGPLSQAMYVGAGAAGIPWFAPAAGAGIFTRGGLAVVTGVTGGYLLSYPVAALLVGFLGDRYVRHRSFTPILCTLLGAVLVIYAFGAIQLAAVMRSSLGDTMLYAVVPFVPGDVLKAVVAALILSGVAPRVAFDGEVDAGSRQKLALSRSDLFLVIALMAAVWSLVPIIRYSYSDTISLPLWKLSFPRDGVVVYYSAAAGVASLCILATLSARAWLRRVGGRLRWLK